MKVRAGHRTREKSMLVNVAESIGTTLGKIAKKAKDVEASALEMKPAAKLQGSRKRAQKGKQTKTAQSRSSTSLAATRGKARAKTRGGTKASAGRKA